MANIPDQEGNVVGFYQGRPLAPEDYDEKVHKRRIFCENGKPLYHAFLHKNDGSGTHIYRHKRGMTVEKCGCLTKKEEEKKLGKPFAKFKADNERPDAKELERLRKRAYGHPSQRPAFTKSQLKNICNTGRAREFFNAERMAVLLYDLGIILYWEMMYYILIGVALDFLIRLVMEWC